MWCFGGGRRWLAGSWPRWWRPGRSSTACPATRCSPSCPRCL
uniref:Uncharacterized protein n=1 Tax=Arundo donax TaxID=35708 RepID=A0A0A9G8Z3_ARUDO